MKNHLSGRGLRPIVLSFMEWMKNLLYNVTVMPVRSFKHIIRLQMPYYAMKMGVDYPRTYQISGSEIPNSA